MGKYTPLGQFLATADKENIDISFAEIESLLGFPLPTSAYTHRERDRRFYQGRPYLQKPRS